MSHCRPLARVFPALVASLPFVAACHHVNADFAGGSTPVVTSSSSHLARYLDADDDGAAGPGDRIVIPFDFPVELDDATVADLVLGVLEDRFGVGATVEEGPAENEITVVLGFNPKLRTRGRHVQGGKATNSPSGIGVRQSATPGGVKDAQTGADVATDGALDIVPGFVPGNSSAFGVDHADIVAGDINCDGILDLAAANLSVADSGGGGGFTIYLGLGGGDFDVFVIGLEPGKGGPNLPRKIALADVTKNGRPDVILGRQGNDEVWRNDGDDQNPVQFTLIEVLSGSSDTRTLEVFDGDGDGALDIAIAVTNSVRFYRNFGGGSFGGGEELLANTVAVDLATGDFDRDGDLDLVLAEDGPNRVLENAGDGTFAVGAALGSGRTLSLAVGDLEPDGSLDIVAGNADEDAIWRGMGDGTFTASGDLGDAGRTQALLLVDVDRDTRLDLVAGRDDEVLVFANIVGVLTDTEQRIPLEDVIALAGGDVDGDSDPDIVVLGSVEPPQAWDGSLSGTIGTTNYRPSPQDLGIGPVFAIATGDVDRDGDPDLLLGANQVIEVRFNEGLGVYSQPDVIPVAGSRAHDLVLADVDADGDLDILAAIIGTSVGLFLNEGDGVFVPGAPFIGVTPQATSIDAADIDCDGDVDFVIGSNRGLEDQVYYNLGHDLPSPGNGNWQGFGDPVSLPGALQTSDVVLGDLDCDGFPDLVTAHGPNEPNRVWLNDGTGTLVLGPQTVGALDTRSLALGDVDRDGALDLVTGAVAGEILWINDGTGQFVETQTLSNSDTFAVRLFDADNDGWLDLLVGNNLDQGIVLWSNAQNGQFENAPTKRFKFQSIRSLHAADVDQDGDAEFLAGKFLSDATALWLNL